MSLSVLGCSSWETVGLHLCSGLSHLEHSLNVCDINGPTFNAQQSGKRRVQISEFIHQQPLEHNNQSIDLVARYSIVSEEDAVPCDRIFRYELVNDASLSNDLVLHYAANKCAKFTSLPGVEVIGSHFFSEPAGALIIIAYTPKPKQTKRVISHNADEIKFLSFNIWVGGGLSLHSCVRVMADSNADIICVQEATPLTMEIISNYLGATLFSLEHSILTFLDASLSPVNHNSVLIKLNGDIEKKEIYISNIHLTAYPYPPHTLIVHGIDTALSLEAQVQLPEMKQILAENAFAAPAAVAASCDDATTQHTVMNQTLAASTSWNNVSDCDDTPTDAGYSVAATPVFNSLACSPSTDPQLVFPTVRSAGEPLRNNRGTPNRLDIICGDFNCPSHLDRCWLGTKLVPRSDDDDNSGEEATARIDWGTSQACYKAGFTDTFRHCNPIQPQAFMSPVCRRGPGHSFYSWSPMGSREKYECFDRIDFVYCRRADAAGLLETAGNIVVSCEHLGRVGAGDVEWPSDHRAVLATIRV